MVIRALLRPNGTSSTWVPAPCTTSLLPSLLIFYFIFLIQEIIAFGFVSMETHLYDHFVCMPLIGFEGISQF